MCAMHKPECMWYSFRCFFLDPLSFTLQFLFISKNMFILSFGICYLSVHLSFKTILIEFTFILLLPLSLPLSLACLLALCSSILSIVCGTLFSFIFHRWLLSVVVYAFCCRMSNNNSKRNNGKKWLAHFSFTVQVVASIPMNRKTINHSKMYL